MVLLHCCAARGLTLKKDEEVSGGGNVLTVFPRTAQICCKQVEDWVQMPKKKAGLEREPYQYPQKRASAPNSDCEITRSK